MDFHISYLDACISERSAILPMANNYMDKSL